MTDSAELVLSATNSARPSPDHLDLSHGLEALFGHHEYMSTRYTVSYTVTVTHDRLAGLWYVQDNTVDADADAGAHEPFLCEANAWEAALRIQAEVGGEIEYIA